MLIFLISVRAKVRDCIDGYSASDNYWLRCLYEGEKGNPENVEEGFLKSALLVKVWTLPIMSPCVRIIDRLTTRRTDLSDDFYISLVCTGEP